MAKSKKDTSSIEGDIYLGEPTEKLNEEVLFEVPVIEVKPETEIEFLERLLTVQNTGSWHGPVAGLIKERLAVIKNK
jgi:hypothetical protein